LHIDLDSNSKCQLPHMRIADNNYANAYCNRMAQMRLLKSDNRILQMRIRMQILLIIASVFSPLLKTINSCDILHNLDFNCCEAFGLFEVMEISSSKRRPIVSWLDDSKEKPLFFIFYLESTGLL